MGVQEWQRERDRRVAIYRRFIKRHGWPAVERRLRRIVAALDTTEGGNGGCDDNG